jgi:adenine-specific DNA-methyltransferase
LDEYTIGKIAFGPDEKTTPRLVSYLFESDSQVMPSVFYSYAQIVTQEFIRLMDKKVFDNPKGWKDILRIVSYLSNPNDTILDFFAGSATTAHAVMQLNAEDGGNRKFIMVQLPEKCDEKSEAFKAGYSTIAEISKERIRRAGKKIKTELEEKQKAKKGDLFESSDSASVADLDIGFRVLKVDSSNMADVYYTPDAVNQDLLSQMEDNIKPDRSAMDLLFQVLLDWGVDLTLPITTETVSGNEVFFVDDNSLAACFEKNGDITEDFCRELAGRKPLRVVFRDSGFKDDSVKINVEQIFKLMSPHTEVRTV